MKKIEILTKVNIVHKNLYRVGLNEQKMNPELSNKTHGTIEKVFKRDPQSVSNLKINVYMHLCKK